MRGALLGLASFTFAAFGLTNQSASASDSIMLGGVGSMHDAQFMTLQGSPAIEAETLNAYFPVARGVARAGARVAWGAGRVAVGSARWVAGYPVFRPWGAFYRPWWGVRPGWGWRRPAWGWGGPWWGWNRPPAWGWAGPWWGWNRPVWGWGPRFYFNPVPLGPWCDVSDQSPQAYCSVTSGSSVPFESVAQAPGVDLAQNPFGSPLPRPSGQALIVQAAEKPVAKKLEYPAYGETLKPKRSVTPVLIGSATAQ